MTQTLQSEQSCLIEPSVLTWLSVPLWIFDVDNSRVLWANDAALSLWQADHPDDLYARDLSADIGQALADRLADYQAKSKAQSQVFKEQWTLYEDGKPCPYDISIQGHTLPDGRTGLLCQAKGPSGKSRSDVQSKQALRHAPAGIAIYAMNGDPLYVNAAAKSDGQQVLQTLKSRFTNPVDYQAIMDGLAVARKAKRVCQVQEGDDAKWQEINAHSYFDSATGHDVIIISSFDVTHLKEQEQRVLQMSHRDFLTGLYNRNYVNKHFPAAIANAQAEERQLAMLLIDLDDFKAINDTLGHFAGDKFLVHVGKMIKKALKGAGTVARLGGDEFAILYAYSEKSEVEELCNRLLSTIATHFSIDDHVVFTKASVGISLFPEHGSDVTDLMRHADLALYEAKRTGRDTHCYFHPSLEEAATLRRLMEKDLNRAICDNEFVLYYQPRVDCQSQTVLSVEALMRWNHPTQGLIPPGKFIPVLEETGLIHQVGDWIIKQAGIDQRKLASNGFDIPISINISPKQFEHPDFAARLISELAKTGCQANNIEIEITESMLMGEGYDAHEVLQAICNAGFSIAVDDFGTGYSNLAYIQDYPISSLKVDRSFVEMIEDRTSVVNLILSLCRLVGLTAVAEGVETIDQLEWLQSNHCDQYQGFLYSRPIPLDDLIALLRNPPKDLHNLNAEILADHEISWAV